MTLTRYMKEQSCVKSQFRSTTHQKAITHVQGNMLRTLRLFPHLELTKLQVKYVYVLNFFMLLILFFFKGFINARFLLVFLFGASEFCII